MTIRDYLKRRARRVLTVILLSLLALPVAAAISNNFRLFTILALSALAVFLGALVAYWFFITCPRCKVRIGRLAAEIVADRKPPRRVSFCPYCGVKLDEPLAADKGDER